MLLAFFLQGNPVPEDEFMAKWSTAIGDTFVPSMSLKLLTVRSIPFATIHIYIYVCLFSQGNYLCASSFSLGTTLSYFPCAELPADPATRFVDLFLTRARWKAEDIVPYLSDIAVDTKDLDKLLLKYARALTDKDGLWYTARAR
jgi:sister chromatid cohesion protein DCC1